MLRNAEFHGNPKESNFSNMLSKELTDFGMPGLLDTVFEQTVESPSDHFRQVSHPSEKHMTARDFLLSGGQMSDIRDQRTLSDPSLSGDKSNPEAFVE
jgi:hypothetical protein